MSINAVDLLENIIVPTLQALDMGSPAAEKLLLGTAAQESNFDPFSHHHDGIGIYQITPEQHRSAWDDYLAFRPDLASKVRGLASQHQFLKNPDQELRVNLIYSTAIAWVIYLQTENQLPAADDVDGLGQFWKETFCHRQHALDCARQFARWIRANPVAAA